MIVHRRMVLRQVSAQATRLVLSQGKRNRECIRALKAIHDNVLRYRVRFGIAEVLYLFNVLSRLTQQTRAHWNSYSLPIHSLSQVSTARAGREQFDVWSHVAGLHRMREDVSATIADLHSFYDDIAQTANQKRLDLLSIVLGFLGLAQLAIDVFFAINESNTPGRTSIVYVPAITTSLCFILAVFFILYSRSLY